MRNLQELPYQEEEPKAFMRTVMNEMLVGFTRYDHLISLLQGDEDKKSSIMDKTAPAVPTRIRDAATVLAKEFIPAKHPK
jgi:hypothetical protein